MLLREKVGPPDATCLCIYQWYCLKFCKSFKVICKRNFFVFSREKVLNKTLCLYYISTCQIYWVKYVISTGYLTNETDRRQGRFVPLDLHKWNTTAAGHHWLSLPKSGCSSHNPYISNPFVMPFLEYWQKSC